MTKYYEKKGNRVVKTALLSIIQDIMFKNATANFCWLDEGYESDEDMIRFTSGGHKCLLLGVGCPDETLSTLPLTVMTDWEGEPNQTVDVTLNLSEIRINTLERIACEVYNTLWDPEEDEEWDFIREDVVAAWLDTDFYPYTKPYKVLENELRPKLF